MQKKGCHIFMTPLLCNIEKNLPCCLRKILSFEGTRQWEISSLNKKEYIPAMII